MPARRTHDGVWLSAGAGGGWTRVSCAICSSDRRAGPSGYARVGTTLRPGLLFAIEADGWTREHGDVRNTLMSFGAAAQMHPDPRGGVFLRAGPSYVRYAASGGVSTNLFGLLVGAGYEIKVADRLHITNYVNLLASSFGSLRSERGTVANDVSLSLLQFGIGLTRY